jgi:hypothetical protein
VTASLQIRHVDTLLHLPIPPDPHRYSVQDLSDESWAVPVRPRTLDPRLDLAPDACDRAYPQPLLVVPQRTEESPKAGRGR